MLSDNACTSASSRPDSSVNQATDSPIEVVPKKVQRVLGLEAHSQGEFQQTHNPCGDVHWLMMSTRSCTAYAQVALKQAIMRLEDVNKATPTPPEVREDGAIREDSTLAQASVGDERSLERLRATVQYWTSQLETMAQTYPPPSKNAR